MALACGTPDHLIRYQFSLRTADFLLCRACGVYLGAITVDGRFGIINTNALVDRPAQLPPVATVSYDGESSTGRLDRRAERWTPVRPLV